MMLRQMTRASRKRSRALNIGYANPNPTPRKTSAIRRARIIQRDGGGFVCALNAQAAVDESAHIIVTAELVNSAANSGRLATILAAVQRDVSDDAKPVLTVAGYRSAVMFEQLRNHPSELIVALGQPEKKKR